MKKNLLLSFLAVATSTVSFAGGSEWSRFSEISVSAGNTDSRTGGNLTLIELESVSDNNGNAVTLSPEMSFTGVDRNGFDQTMTLTGSAYAHGNWKLARTSSEGMLANSFYSPDNPWLLDSGTNEYNPDGVPDIIDFAARAGWNEVLLFGGTATGYRARAIYNLSGINTGEAFTYMNVQFGTNPSDFHFWAEGTWNETVTSEFFNVGSEALPWHTSIVSTFQPQTQYYGDGTDILGQSLWNNSLELEGFEVFDENGVLATHVTITGLSGETYAIVPEPASVLGFALALGFLGLYRRRQ